MNKDNSGSDDETIKEYTSKDDKKKSKKTKKGKKHSI